MFCALNQAAAYKAAAMDRANRGQSTGRGGSPRVNPKDRRDYSDTEKFLGGIVASWQCARADALEDYRRAVFPERYESFDL